MKQRSIPPELLDAFRSFLEYTDAKVLSRILRTQFIEYCRSLQDGIPDSFDDYLPQLTFLFELLDAVEDHSPIA
jgi:hypothetical protein